MGRIDHGRSGILEQCEFFQDHITRLGVNADSRLVKKKEPWFAQDTCGQIGTPLHPPGKSENPLVTPLFQPDQLKAFPNPVFKLLTTQAIQPAEIPQVFPCGQIRIKGNFLWYKTQKLFCFIRISDDINPINSYATPGRPQQSTHNGDGRGLSGSVGAQKPKDFSLVYGNIKTIKRGTG